MTQKIDIEKRNEIIKNAYHLIRKKEQDKTLTKSNVVSKIIADMKEILKDVD